MSEVDVIVTTFEKGDAIAACLRRLVFTLEKGSHVFRIFVLDDGSTDRTVQEAESVEDSRITVIPSTLNLGKGAQIKRGLAKSIAEVVVIFDGDLDIHPKSLVNAIDVLQAEQLDVVVGSKPHRDSEVVYPASRRVLSMGFRLISRVLFNLSVRDTQTGMKAFRGDVLRSHAHLVVEDGFLFDLELLARMSIRGVKVKEVPVAIDFDFTSTISPASVVAMAKDVWRVKRTLLSERA
ncbi:MAG: glycosyltransferase family 2 protein [Ilumatobacteraceae bacterium]